MTLILHILFLFGSAHAQTLGTPICNNDVQKLCSGIAPGEGRIGKCLKDNNTSISLECRAYFEEYRKERIQAKTLCYKSVRKLCLKVVPGDGRVIKCLYANAKKVEQACLEQLRKLDTTYKLTND